MERTLTHRIGSPDFHPTPFIESKYQEQPNEKPNDSAKESQMSGTGEGKKQRKKRKVKEKKDEKMRVHLKTETATFKNEYVAYNVEQPIRVAVRLEYLMGSTKVRLNDGDYMNKLYNALTEEEAKDLIKSTELREHNEIERVKKLVIEGQMKPPKDLHYLYNHPVFRVNAMLKRLEDNDLSFQAVEKPKSKITPVEPYEFDGDKFFQNLHKNGTYWVPSEELLAREEKRAGKIERARERLREKRYQEQEENKALRVLYSKNESVMTVQEFDDDENQSNPTYFHSYDGEDERQQAARAKQRLRIQQTKQKDQQARTAARNKKRKEIVEKHEEERRLKLEMRNEERERKLQQARDEQRAKIIEQYKSKQELSDGEIPKRYVDPDSKFAYLYKKADTPPGLMEDASLQKLRKGYDVRGSAMLDKYRIHDNHLITNYLNRAEDAENMYDMGGAIKDVYQRKQLTANDFIKKLSLLI